MLGKKKILAPVLPIVLFAAHAAQAGMSVSAVGVLNFANSNIRPTPATTTSGPGTTLGFGFLGSMGVFPGFSGELGVLYVPRKVGTNTLSGTAISALTSNSLEIPLLIRFTGLPVVSIGAGIYYSVALGNGTLSMPNQADTPVNYAAANLSTTDFGLEASIAASYPILPTLSLVGDLRYLLGLTDQDSTSATSAQYRDFQFLAGVSFGF